MANKKQSQRYQKKEEKVLMPLTNLETYHFLHLKGAFQKETSSRTKIVSRTSHVTLHFDVNGLVWWTRKVQVMTHILKTTKPMHQELKLFFHVRHQGRTQMGPWAFSRAQGCYSLSKLFLPPTEVGWFLYIKAQYKTRAQYVKKLKLNSGIALLPLGGRDIHLGRIKCRTEVKCWV